MTIFDSLKYPIGSPPTLSEFNHVPTPIYIKWLKRCGWMSTTVTIENRTTLSDWYRLRANNVSAIDDLALLRKMIAEYNP